MKFPTHPSLVKQRNQAFGGGIAYGLATLVSLVVANPLKPPMPQSLVLMTLVFLAIQLICWGRWLWMTEQMRANPDFTGASFTPAK